MFGMPSPQLGSEQSTSHVAAAPAVSQASPAA
jgi:hypothetical protein